MSPASSSAAACCFDCSASGLSAVSSSHLRGGRRAAAGNLSGFNFWDIEIAALDVESCHQNEFGQSEDASQLKSKRIYLVCYRYVRCPRIAL